MFYWQLQRDIGLRRGAMGRMQMESHLHPRVQSSMRPERLRLWHEGMQRVRHRIRGLLRDEFELKNAGSGSGARPWGSGSLFSVPLLIKMG